MSNFHMCLLAATPLETSRDTKGGGGVVSKNISPSTYLNINKNMQIFSFFRAVSDELGRVQHLKKTTEAKLAQRMSKMFA